eukprot:m.277344 g.277344  ORF g.277344 m.277344 type:complete len:72 (-) comp54872_c0_seq3:154-369(-)
MIQNSFLRVIVSTNGTFINGTKIEPQRYYELREKDVLKFGEFRPGPPSSLRIAFPAYQASSQASQPASTCS